MRKIIFELCAETIDACLAARDGGAHRIELCSALSEGGLTPSHGLVRAAIKSSGLPVHVLIRPRGYSFQYTESEITLMREDILHVRQLGAAGVVLGLLRPDNSVDIERTRALVQLAHPMKVTFHRAFDETPSPHQAIEDVIATGADRILTSGGEQDVVAGSVSLAKLVLQAAGRINVAVGGGLRLRNAAAIARDTGAQHFHGSLRQKMMAADTSIALASSAGQYSVEADTVRKVIHRLQNA
jgi:copper homeostasis protein